MINYIYIKHLHITINLYIIKNNFFWNFIILVISSRYSKIFDYIYWVNLSSDTYVFNKNKHQHESRCFCIIAGLNLDFTITTKSLENSYKIRKNIII